MKGQVVVVTGAGSGIGAATAFRFSRLGATVVAVDINVLAAKATADGAWGDDVLVRECDVASREQMNSLAVDVHRTVGPVSLVVNNAGVGTAGTFLDQSQEDWDWLMGINLDGVVNGCRAFGPDMLERRSGHVVNVASGAAWVPNRHMAAYCSSKASVLMFSRCLRADWRASGVGVSVVCPGVINTPIHGNTRVTMDEADVEKLNKRAEWVFRRGHSADKVARAVQSAHRRNRAVVPVGIEAQLARVTPDALLGLAARL